jgi:hypothetical protein
LRKAGEKEVPPVMFAAILTAIDRLPRRSLLVAGIAAGVMGLSAAPALAAPKWHVTMTHLNPFGGQASACPSHQAEPMATPPCGVDPLTEVGPLDKGESFPRESGSNAYEINVENKGTETAGIGPSVGETLRCIGGPKSAASLAYGWLAGGTEIPGATEPTYMVPPGSEGKAIQCKVTASGSEGAATAAVSNAAVVVPLPSPLPPTGGRPSIVPSGKVIVGQKLKCLAEPGTWSPSPTAFEYQWLRNGAPIPGANSGPTVATSFPYTLTGTDEGKAIQCQVTATGAGGSSAAVNPGKNAALVGEAELAPPRASALLPDVVVVDQLPAGITFQTEKPALGTGWQCTTERGEVECVTSKPLPATEKYEPIVLRVHVNPEAVNPSTNIVTVSGGGGGTASPTQGESETPILPAVPFGIDSFATGLKDESCVGHPPEIPNTCSSPFGNLFSQAGGHPFAYTTDFALNYTTSDFGPSVLGPAGGAAKETRSELPPGLIGNVQGRPRCAIQLLLSTGAAGCPESTAVGYASEVALHGGNGIVKGKPNIFPGVPNVKNSSLIYNLEPSAGHPAEFGFTVAYQAPTDIVLDANVRSNGDYGVTVNAIGGNGINLAELQGAHVTFCSNGATQEGFKIENVAEELKSYHCNPAPASSKPFLANPTQCSGPAPVTVLRADPWREPDFFSSMQDSSFFTGCDKLHFEPKLEFAPSPQAEGGTSQADEPTGMTMNLKVPQTNEAAVPATPALRNFKMTLPAGMTVSPSAADGLQACSNAQFGLGTEFGPSVEAQKKHAEEQTKRFVPEAPAKPASCPLASQIASVEVFTPLLSGAPSIQGVAVAGPEAPRGDGELTCSPGMWGNGPTSFKYEWLKEGAPIAGAIGTTYTLPSEEPLAKEDVGKAIQCRVTASNDARGSSVAVSEDAVVLEPPKEGVGKVKETEHPPPFPPSNIPAPSGSASPGHVLTCTSETWTGSPAPTLTYGWLRGGTAIPGASSQTYTLTSEDEGKAVQCQVTGHNAGGETIADSAAVIVSPVPSPPPPLPGAPLQGQLFVAEPECSPCTNADAQDGKAFRLFLQAQDPRDGVIVKLHGSTSANPLTGQLTTTFEDQPQQPFELLQLKLNGGPRATLASPQSCGPAVTSADLMPWSAPGLGGPSGTESIAGIPDATPSSSYNVDWNGAGGACPGASPFNPSFNAGTTGPNAIAAGMSPNFSLTFARQDREQDLSGVQVNMPLGLVGKIAAIATRCGEAEVHAAEANAGECPAASQIGTATAGAGPGPHPFYTQGKVYLTGPYKGAPFGLAIVTLAKAGPFNLGNIVVRSAISVDPNTAAVTVTSDPLPQIHDGVPLRLREVNASVNREGFMLNPTNCSAQKVSATLSSAPPQSVSAQVSSPFHVGGCDSLPFSPKLTAEAGGQGSKANGTSFIVKVQAAPGQANIGKTFLQLPVALPSRLSTIQKACLAAVFEANPASCPEGSNIGMAVANTPLLKAPLVGPAYLVSHGNAAFPDVEFVLQGEGITQILDGKTDIKKGITYSRFETLPDAPVSTFETVLPAGPHSALTANVPENEHFSLCNTTLLMPTEITGQNGALLKQTTHIKVTGCGPTVKIAKVRVRGNALLVTINMSSAGNVSISGRGLRTTKKHLAAGTHQIRVRLTKLGTSLHRHHKKTSVKVKLTVGKQVVAKATSVRL